MAGATLTLPGVGAVPRNAVVGIGVAGAAFVGYRYWQARNGSGAAGDDSTISDGDFGAVDSSIPDVLGAVSDTNSYGSDTGEDTTSTTTITTNAAWSQAAVSQLEQSDTWSYTDIVTALGNYLGSRPLTTTQTQIVQAAIAVQGYPPVGSFSLIPGGTTTITTAPTGLHLVTSTKNSATVGFSPVAGAASYRAYRGLGANVGSSVGPQIEVVGLSPNTTYKIYVRAVTASGTTGPNSATLSVKTKSK